MNNDLNFICKQTIETSKEAGGFIRENAGKLKQEDISSKSWNNLVTYVDTGAEEILVNSLSKLLPEAGFITEEKTIKQEDKELMWIIDPLDGTTNFIHQLPCFAVSIGLIQNKKLILGVVYEINQDECFYAFEGSQAYMNGQEIRVSQSKELSSSLIATGFPYDDFSRSDDYMGLLDELTQSSRGIRRFGSAAVDLAYVACGRFDVFFEYGLNPWDIAGGAMVVKQAGGIVSDFNKQEDFLFGEEIIASNSLIHNSFIEKLQKHFN